MDKLTRVQIALALLCAAAIASLFVMPSTQWLVRTQLEMPFSSTAALDGSVQNAAETEEIQARNNGEGSDVAAAPGKAEQYLHDLGLALTVNPEGHKHSKNIAPEIVLRNLWVLTRRYPNQASLYAHILRFSTAVKIQLHRDEEYQLQGQPIPTDQAQATTDPDELAKFDKAATTGAKLDPDNSFFPFIRAAGLFAAHKDDQAMASIQEASLKSTWNDYLAEDFLSRVKLAENVYGRISYLTQLAMYTGALMPHYATCRATARIATYMAIEAQRNGNVDQALAMRHAIMQCGSLMRVHSSSYAGSLVGVAMTSIAARKDAQEANTTVTADSAEQKSQARLQEYYDYLNYQGKTAEVKWVQNEIAAGDQVKALGEASNDSATGGKSTSELVVFWTAEMLLLANALSLLVIGVIAAISVIKNRPVAAAWIGVIILALVVIFCEFCWIQALIWLWAQASSAAINNSDSGAGVLSSGSVGDVFSGAMGPRILAIASTLALPIVMFLCVSVGSLLLRQTWGTALSKSFKGIGIAMAFCLVLLYSALIPVTAAAEDRARDDLDKMVVHEGPYYAALLGKTWPQ